MICEGLRYGVVGRVLSKHPLNQAVYISPTVRRSNNPLKAVKTAELPKLTSQATATPDTPIQKPDTDSSAPPHSQYLPMIVPTTAVSPALSILLLLLHPLLHWPVFLLPVLDVQCQPTPRRTPSAGFPVDQESLKHPAGRKLKGGWNWWLQERERRKGHCDSRQETPQQRSRWWQQLNTIEPDPRN